MHKEWYSAAELVGLPGMPATDRAVRLRANKYGWLSRPKSYGKGNEFHASCFPMETKEFLAKAFLQETNSSTEAGIHKKSDTTFSKKSDLANAESKLTVLNQLPESKKDIALAKIEIVRVYAEFIKSFKHLRKTVDAECAFVQKFNERKLNISGWVYAEINSVSRYTLRRWQQILETEGPQALAGKYKKTKESLFEQQPAMAEFVLALVTSKPHMLKKFREVCKLLNVKRIELKNTWPEVSVSAVQRYLNKLASEKIAELAYATNPREFNNSHRPLFGHMYPWVDGPNQVWELDSTPTDVQLNVGGKARRYSIIGAIDVFTRRLMVVLMPSSSSEGICLLLRKCMLTWGLPEPDSVVRTDNGSDYVSKTTSAIFHLLELNQSKATAFSGWEKPFIERAFKTLSHGLMEKLPAYVGHNVEDKKRLQDMRSFAESIGAKRKQRDQELLELSLTPSELQTILDDWLEFDYHHQQHSGLNSQTPFQVYAASGYRPRLPANPHSLDLLLNYVGTATVIRGRVKAASVMYTAPELMEPMWDRKTVRVFLDPSDVGRATLYPADSWGSCVEAVNMDLIGRDIDPAQFRERRKEATRALRDFKRTAEKLQEQYGINNIAAVELAQKKLANASLTGFNPTTEITDNAAIAALSQTATALMADKKEPVYSEAELKAIAARRAELSRRREMLDEQNSKVLRSEHEQAEFLTRESLHRELTGTEQEWLKKFRVTHVMTRRRLDRILEEGKRANG